MITQLKRYWNLDIYLKTLFYIIFNCSVYPLIYSTKTWTSARVRSATRHLSWFLLLKSLFEVPLPVCQICTEMQLGQWAMGQLGWHYLDSSWPAASEWGLPVTWSQGLQSPVTSSPKLQVNHSGPSTADDLPEEPKFKFPISSHSCSGSLAWVLHWQTHWHIARSVPILILCKLTPLGGGCKGTYSRMARNSWMARDEHSLQHLCSSTTKR